MHKSAGSISMARRLCAITTAPPIMDVSLPRHASVRFEPTVWDRTVRRQFEINRLELASLMPASWNPIARWLEQIDALRRAA
jgi:hypothetical protein